MKGIDMGCKDANNYKPSGLGIVAAVVYMISVIQETIAIDELELRGKYSAGLLAICFMSLLGLADDILELPWIFKMSLPAVASLPLLCMYTGVTYVTIPNLTAFIFWNKNTNSPTWISDKLSYIYIDIVENTNGTLINCNYYYYLYMFMLTIFCANSINIYSGINGLEVGQSLVVAMAILCINIYEMSISDTPSNPHLLSLMLILPFIGVSISLLKYNWYPAKIFVGDSYCYFSGVTIAAVGILGHFSKTLILLLLPQIINFLYSCPQILHLYPCPRHRLPGVDAKTNLRIPSTFIYNNKEYQNMTLINIVLYFLGPRREEELTLLLIKLQIFCCVLGIFIRYYVGSYWLYRETIPTLQDVILNLFPLSLTKR